MDWTNGKAVGEESKGRDGITHADVDMTSAEEMASFDEEKDDPTKDVGDIGLSMSPEAENRMFWARIRLLHGIHFLIGQKILMGNGS